MNHFLITLTKTCSLRTKANMMGKSIKITSPFGDNNVGVENLKFTLFKAP